MPTARPDVYPGTPGTILYAGIEPPPSGPARLITTVGIKSTVGSLQTDVPTLFGQPFEAGDFDAETESLYAIIDEETIPVQFDDVATHPDGTVRHCVVSTRLASLAANATQQVEIWAGGQYAQTPGSFNTDAWDPVVIATMTSGSVPWTASPRATLLANIASNTGIVRNGPVVKEMEFSVPFLNASSSPHAHLRLYVNVRMYANGSIRTCLSFENGWLMQASPADLTYSVSCTQGAGGSSIFTQASFTHHHHARWRKVFWTGGEIFTRPVHNKNYVLDSRIVQNLNRDRVVASTALTNILNDSNTNRGPMDYCTLTTEMGGTGGRDEIAPVPKSTSMYLISQDDRAWTAMLRNADAAASAPVHYRDQTTGNPVDIISRPTVALRYPSVNVPNAASSTPWIPDIAHQGSYTFIPYALTGDRWYLEEMTFWSAWNVAAVDPGGRGSSGAAGWLAPVEQLRGLAWGFRSLLECAYILPDNHPMKTYFTTIKNNNVSHLNANYTSLTDNQFVTVLGACKGIYNDNQIPGYENDFFMYVLCWALENGETGLEAAAENVGRYIVGRFTAAVQALGFCTSGAAHYWFESREDNGSGPAYPNWSTYAIGNGNGSSCGTVANAGDPAYPDWAEGYAAVSRGMLGAAVNAGITNAQSAYDRWVAFTPDLDADFVNSPQYNIVPRV